MLKISLFGEPTFELNKKMQTEQFVTNKAKALMCYMVMQDGVCSRETLIDLLWGGSKMKNAQNSLRNALFHLKKQFEGYLVISRTDIYFDRSQPHWLDVKQFEGTSGDMPLAQRVQQLELYQGKFLVNIFVRDAIEFEEWVLIERQRLNAIYVDQLKRVVKQCLSEQEYRTGLTFVEQLLEQEPWLEEAQEAKMNLLAYTGQRHQALQYYKQYQQMMAIEFAKPPSIELQALYKQISSGTLTEQPSLPYSSFDPVWNEALADFGSLQPDQSRHHLQEMPQLDLFFGREQEVAELQQMLMERESRLVTIVGIGGQGKTVLAAQICQMTEVLEHYEWMIWLSLINAPLLQSVVVRLLQLFYQHLPGHIPDDFEAQQNMLFAHLREARCLLIFDNTESILNPGEGGDYQSGYEVYGSFIRRMGQTEHQSCLLITSRELPTEVRRLERDTTRVSTLSLTGVGIDVGKQILQHQQIDLSEAALASLVSQYSGNPLALKLIADTIETLFFGDVEAFLAEESLIYGQIKDVLDQQISRLSEVEEAALIWLAIERKSVPMSTVWTNMYDLQTRQVLLEVFRTLMRRSLLQQESGGFSLQNVVMEYLSDRLIDKICDEISTGEPDWLQRFALMKAQSKDYVRQSQQRVFLRPIAERLVNQYGRAGTEMQLQAMLQQFQTADQATPLGYGAANILHLLIHLGVDLCGFDLSNLTIWQAHLQDAVLPDVNLSGSDLTGSVFMNAQYQTMDIAFSPDGQYLATAHTVEEVVIWRVEDLTVIQTFKLGNQIGDKIRFSSDGRWLASTSNGDDNKIYVWDYQSRTTQYILTGHLSDIHLLDFSPDSQLLASASFDTTVRLWDMATGKAIATLEGHNSWVFAVVFTPDGKWLISTGADGRIFIWSVETRSCLHILQGHERIYWALAISSDGKWLATAGTDGVIKLWALPSLELRYALTGHEELMSTLAFSPDSSLLASQCMDGTIRLWDTETGQLIRTMFTNTRDAYGLDFHPDGRLLATCDETYPIRLWDVRTGEVIYRVKSSRQNEPYQLLFSPTDHFLISAHINSAIRLWDLTQAPPTSTLFRTEVNAPTRYIAISADGHTLVCTYGPNIQVWAFPEMRLLRTLATPAKRLIRIALSQDGKQVAVPTNDYLIRIGDVNKLDLDLVLEGHISAIHYLDFSPDGQLLASSSDDNTIRLWDTITGTCLHTIQTPGESVYEVCFSPDSRYLISGLGQTLCMWDVQTGEQVRQFPPHPVQDRRCPIAMNSSGTIVASVAQDFKVILWDLQQGQILRYLKGDAAYTGAIAFSADGTMLAVGTNNETICLWNVETGKLISTLEAEVPYKGMNIMSVIGLAPATKVALKQLGAIEQA